MTKTMTFKIEGEFITRLAREQCHYEGRFNYAMELLESGMQTDQLTKEEIKEKAFSILDGRAVLKGTYPDGDYGFEYLETQDEDWKLGDLIEKIVNEKKKIEEENDEIRTKYLFVIDNIEDYRKRELNREYEEEFGERLFENDARMDTTDIGNSLLDSFMKRMSSDTNDDYGWLEPNGTFHAVEWGEHQEWADDYVEEHFEAIGKSTTYTVAYAGDYLTERGWILLHNPAQGIAMITKNPLKEMTKAQKDFLYGYYIDRGCEREANTIWEEGK